MRRIKAIDAVRFGARSSSDIADYLSAAASFCAGRGENFTELRRSALRVLLEAESPLRAYEMIPRLETALSRKISAMTVYRSLEFLMAQNLIAQLKSHNAFVPRARPGNLNFCVLYVCERCGSSIEIEKPDLRPAITADLAALDFKAGGDALEMRGLCFRCKEEGEGGPLRVSGAGPNV